MFIVTADDHDYDAMNQWVVGVFSTIEKAKEAVKLDKEEYKGRLKSGPNYDITECNLDERFKGE